MREGSLELDGSEPVTERSPAKLRSFNTDAGLYIGMFHGIYWSSLLPGNFPNSYPRPNSRWNAETRLLHAAKIPDRNNWLHLGGGAGRRAAAQFGLVYSRHSTQCGPWGCGVRGIAVVAVVYMNGKETNGMRFRGARQIQDNTRQRLKRNGRRFVWYLSNQWYYH